jgi:hypothetical protein
MNIYLRQLFSYFENVLHPAGGSSVESLEKKKRKNTKSNSTLQASPESWNLRGGVAKKQEKLRRNPAP